jgi:hypothetical protein
MEKWKKFGAFIGGMLTILLVTGATDRWEHDMGMDHGHGDHSHGHTDL